MSMYDEDPDILEISRQIAETDSELMRRLAESEKQDLIAAARSGDEEALKALGRRVLQEDEQS